MFVVNEPLLPELIGERVHAGTRDTTKGQRFSKARDPTSIRHCTSGSSKENAASQIRFFFYLVPPSPAPIYRAMSTPGNNASQNQTSIQGVGTTSTPLLAPARTQKDGVIGNSTVGTFGVRCLSVLSLQVLTIKRTGQVRVGPNAQGLGHISPTECWIFTDVIF